MILKLCTFFTLACTLNLFGVALHAQTLEADTARAYTLLRQAGQENHTPDSTVAFYSEASDLFLKHREATGYVKAQAALMWHFLGQRKLDTALQMRYVLQQTPYLKKASLGAQATFFKSVGGYFFYRAHTDSALHFFAQALRLNQEAYGENSLEVARAYRYLGSVNQQARKYKDALGYYEKSLASYQQSSPQAKGELGAAHVRVGAMLRSLSKFHLALEFLEKGMVLQEQAKVSDETLARTYNVVGIAYSNKNEFDKSLSYYQKSLTLRRERYGENHPDVADVYNNMGIAYYAKDEFSKAVIFYKKSLAIRKTVFGESHPAVIASYINIGLSLSRQGKDEEAILLYEEAEKIIEANEKTPLFHRALLLQNKGGSLLALKDMKGALRCMRQSLALKQQLFSPPHSELAMMYHDIAGVYEATQEYDSAIYFYHKAVQNAAKKSTSLGLKENPQPELALQRMVLMGYLRRKAASLYKAKDYKVAMRTYSAAADCAHLAMQEAREESDKLHIAKRSHAVHTEAALIHFFNAKKR